MKKGIFGTKAKEDLNNDKKVTAMIINKDSKNQETDKVIISGY